MKWKRLAGAAALTLALATVGVELAARQMDLDRLQAEAIAVERPPLEDAHWTDGSALGVAYLPRGLEWDGSNLKSRFGACEADHPGPTVLIYGDSTSVQTALDGDTHAGALWPELLELPSDAQVCGVAEVGYHPADYAELHAVLAPALQPDLVLILLCPNDISVRRPRTGVRQPDGQVLLYEPPAYRLIVPGLWNPWLYDRSEAFRFVHWRLAMGQEQPHQLPVTVDEGVSSTEALAAIQTQQPTQVFMLPKLGEHGPSYEERDRRALAEMGVRAVKLEQPLSQWRRTPDDHVHLNQAGHEVVAAQVQAALDDIWP